MEAKTLGKVLHLAAFHGWQPERISWRPSSASWDTQMVMPHVGPYLSGSVPASDAAGLVGGLKHVLASEGPGLSSDIYMALLSLIAVADGGGFEMEPLKEKMGDLQVGDKVPPSARGNVPVSFQESAKANLSGRLRPGPVGPGGRRQ